MREWCPVCRRMSQVTDMHPESRYEGDAELGYTVTDLDCGHETQTRPRRIGPSPGAPYTGGVVAASTSTRDLTAADTVHANLAARDDPYRGVAK